MQQTRLRPGVRRLNFIGFGMMGVAVLSMLAIGAALYFDQLLLFLFYGGVCALSWMAAMLCFMLMEEDDASFQEAGVETPPSSEQQGSAFFASPGGSNSLAARFACVRPESEGRFSSYNSNQDDGANR